MPPCRYVARVRSLIGPDVMLTSMYYGSSEALLGMQASGGRRGRGAFIGLQMVVGELAGSGLSSVCLSC